MRVRGDVINLGHALRAPTMFMPDIIYPKILPTLIYLISIIIVLFHKLKLYGGGNIMLTPENKIFFESLAEEILNHTESEAEALEVLDILSKLIQGTAI